ncbi:MAG TPA: protoporphyrinogen oxidase [Pyrinomonadaceae bacterium]|nr:protoporphyrinogen oxidase [Pyrinomonadaceae bacterium]
MKRIVIIGAGISGLAAANRLVELSQTTQQPIQLALLEASDRLGGTILTERHDGFLLERGPDSFISEKPEAVALAHRLGLESRLLQTNAGQRRSFIVRQGKLRAVPEGFQLLAPSRMWPFITSNIFSFEGKLRMAGDLLLPRKKRTVADDESLADFVRRRLGREALERMAQPMVGGIYTANPETLSLRATLPRFLELEQEHRSIILGMWRRGRSQSPAEKAGTSGARYSLFLSFDDGIQVLIDALAKKLTGYPVGQDGVQVALRVNTRADKVEQNFGRSGSAWKVTTDWGDTLEADAVCLALPAYQAASLLQRMNRQLIDALKQIKYASTATINLAYRRSDIKHSLNGFGFVVPFIERRSVLACTFSSVKFPGRAPDDHVLLRVFVGGALQPELLELEESKMLAKVRADLRALLGIEREPLFTKVTTWSNSMPQYEVGHLERVKLIEETLNELPGLTLCGNAYRGAGIPDCIRSGETAAEKMMQYAAQ